jgi:hypothetical protein
MLQLLTRHLDEVEHLILSPGQDLAFRLKKLSLEANKRLPLSGMGYVKPGLGVYIKCEQFVALQLKSNKVDWSCQVKNNKDKMLPSKERNIRHGICSRATYPQTLELL